MIDLNLLRVLDALLSEQNVTRAAERTCVTQQAMSGSLRRLRDHFGDELLVRVGRRLEPSPLASALRKPVREAMLSIERMFDTKSIFNPLVSERRFRIAMSDYASVVFLPHVMPLIARQCPNFVVEFRPADNQVFHQVEQGQLDFCLLPSNWQLYQTMSPQGLESITLFQDDFVCAVDADHSDLGKTLNVGEYRALQHCAVRFGTGVRSLVEIAWADAEIDVRPAATATSFTHLLFMISGTRLIATAQRKLVNTLAPLLSIRMLECPIPIGRLDETLSWHGRSNADPAHGFMRNLFAEAARAMAA